MFAVTVLLCVAAQEGSRLPELPVGEVLEGMIEESDPEITTAVLAKQFSDAAVRGKTYRLRVPQTGPCLIELRSHFFDAYLVLRDATGAVLAEDDDGLLGTHSRVSIESLEPGKDYLLDVCALHGDTGKYSIRVCSGNPALLSSIEKLALELEDARARLRIVEETFGPKDAATATSLNNLAVLLDSQGNYAEARPLYECALKIREEVLGPKHPHTATSLNNLAVLLKSQGNYDEARPLYERALKICEEVLGPQHPNTAKSLNNLAALLRSQGNNEEARPLYERALKICEEVLGPQHPDMAGSLKNLAALLESQGNYDEARPLCERALKIYEAVLGPKHPHTAMSLNNLALLLKSQGNYDEARPLFERALKIYEEVLGPKHPSTATSLDNLAELLRSQGNYDEARPLYERALKIKEEVLGPEHPSTATSLNNLALLLNFQGNYDEARLLFERALKICEEVLGPKHPDTATSLKNLAGLLDSQGNYDEARPLFERALKICEEVFGPKHPNTATSLNSLAGLLDSQGNYDEARPLYERALKIKEEVLGPQHPDTAMSLNNLALLLKSQGNYDEARPLFERALRIYEEVLGPKHPSTATSLNNLAALLESLGDYDEARPLYERALKIHEEVLGPKHPNTATSINNLAALLQSQENYDEARPHFERTLKICEEVLGPQHPNTAKSLNNLAALLQSQGNYEEARPLCERAFKIREEVLGPKHPNTASSLHSLLYLFEASGDLSQAIEFGLRGLGISREILERQLRCLSERERFLAVKDSRIVMDKVLSLDARVRDRETGKRVYDEVLQWKGMISRGIFEDREWLRKQEDPAVLSLMDELRRVESQLSGTLWRESSSSRELTPSRLKVLAAQRDRIERDLLRSYTGLEEKQHIDASTVCESLRSEEAFIDFLYYRDRAGLSLAAFVLRKDAPLARFDLGNAEPIRKALQSHPVAIRGERGVISLPDSSPLVQTADLRNLLWNPLAPSLEGATRLFVCPDAEIATLPFETLPGDTKDSYLLERYSFVYVQSAQQLVQGTDDSSGKGILLAGGIDYDQAGKDEEELPPTALAAEAPPPESTPDELRSLQRPFRRLPSTLEEVEDLANLYRRFRGDSDSFDLLEGALASELALRKSIPGKRYVHLATHGFFAPEAVRSLFDAAMEIVEEDPFGIRQRITPAQLTGWMPGQLCGIVLAGANQNVEQGSEDGILTADEITWLDLSGCELIVLSACETGLGLPRGGEHLMGLRRALHLAGARSTITSLWKVNDADTQWLMSQLYRRLWKEEQSKSESLRGAQLDQLERNRARFGEALPGTWGAFVLEGDWR